MHPPTATDGRVLGERTVGGLQAMTLAMSAEGGVEAAFVPAAGMVGCSLRHRGEELLGQRAGLEAYVAERKTMGIPVFGPRGRTGCRSGASRSRAEMW